MFKNWCRLTNHQEEASENQTKLVKNFDTLILNTNILIYSNSLTLCKNIYKSLSLIGILIVERLIKIGFDIHNFLIQ